MQSASSLVIFTIFCYSNTHAAAYLPSYIHPCDFENSNFNKCIKEQMENAIPYFTKGIPEMGVPSLDPIKLGTIVIDGSGLNLTFSEAAMHGVSTSQLSHLKVDLGKKDESMSISFKANLSLTAKYAVDGRILILPIQGQGDAFVSVRNADIQISSKLVHMKDAKGMHFKLSAPDYKYTLESAKFELENLFNGNKQLADATLQFANENWRQLMDDLAPPAIKQIARTGVKAINKFFVAVTIQQIIRNYKQS